MAAGSGSRVGVLGGLAGVILGGFTWITVYGVYLKDPGIWASGIAVAAGLWFVGARVHARFPTRMLALVGAMLLAVAAIDWMYIGLLLPRLPELAASSSVGISRVSLRPIQPMLMAASVAGTALLIWDLLRRRT